MNRLAFLLFYLSMTVLPAVAKEPTAEADSVDLLAQDPDFIRASLLTVEPGNKVYTCYGHAAIRMESPTNGLDYCFTFEMQLGTMDQLRFLFSTAKAGYNVFETKDFLEQYRQEGRGVAQYRLNLAPRQKQELWRRLDEELMRGPVWDYDFLTTNCSSMCVYIVESSLLGERIEYEALHPALTGTYADLLDYISRNAPWSRLFWKMRMGSRGSENGALADKLAPELLAPTWQKAVLSDSTGGKRPMIDEGPVWLLPEGSKSGDPLFTPAMALILFSTIIVLVIILLFHSKKSKV